MGFWVRVRWREGGLTPKRLELSSGSFTAETSIKLNAFHCVVLAIVVHQTGVGSVLMSVPFGLAMGDVGMLEMLEIELR